METISSTDIGDLMMLFVLLLLLLLLLLQDDNVPLGLASVFGSVKSTQEADNVIILQRQAARSVSNHLHEQHQLQKELLQQQRGPNRHKQRRMHYSLEIRKNRFSGELGSVPYVFDPQSLLMRVSRLALCSSSSSNCGTNCSSRTTSA